MRQYQKEQLDDLLGAFNKNEPIDNLRELLGIGPYALLSLLKELSEKNPKKWDRKKISLYITEQNKSHKRNMIEQELNNFISNIPDLGYEISQLRLGKNFLEIKIVEEDIEGDCLIKDFQYAISKGFEPILKFLDFNYKNNILTIITKGRKRLYAIKFLEGYKRKLESIVLSNQTS